MFSLNDVLVFIYAALNLAIIFYVGVKANGKPRSRPAIVASAFLILGFFLVVNEPVFGFVMGQIGSIIFLIGILIGLVMVTSDGFTRLNAYLKSNEKKPDSDIPPGA